MGAQDLANDLLWLIEEERLPADVIKVLQEGAMEDLEKREKTIQTTPRDAESTLAILLAPGPGTQMTRGTAGAENVNIPCKKRMVLNTFQQTGGQGHHLEQCKVESRQSGTQFGSLQPSIELLQQSFELLQPSLELLQPSFGLLQPSSELLQPSSELRQHQMACRWRPDDIQMAPDDTR